MYIKEVLEKDTSTGTLVEYSGYCMIRLLADSIDPPSYPHSEDFSADWAFGEYDHDHPGKRPSNSYYISAAHDYLARAGLGRRDV